MRPEHQSHKAEDCPAPEIVWSKVTDSPCPRCGSTEDQYRNNLGGMTQCMECDP